MATIIERYIQKFRRSGDLYERGKSSIPSGGHGSRTVHPHLVFMDYGEGAVKHDVDGNEFIDYMMGYGALLLGHAHPAVTDAVAERLSKGTHMGSNTEVEVHWAEQVKDLLPSADLVRFTASGTEATLMATRLARAHTGKTKLVKFRQHFHGWHDYVSLESGINTQVGIPGEVLLTVVVVDPEIGALERLLERDSDIAGVILEPTGGHWGQYPLPNPGFLKSLRELTAKHGVVMIMDEVICGFRVSPGGAQVRFDVRPDLTTMAKIVAGGLPGGAVAGKAEIMEIVGSSDPARGLPHPGTFNANPVSASAGIATLELVASGQVNDRADAMAARLKGRLRDALTRTEVAGHIHGISSIVHVALGVECGCDGEACPIPHSELAEATAAVRSQPLKLAMLTEGVDTLGGIGFMVSAVHTEEEIDRTGEAFERALSALREERVV